MFYNCSDGYNTLIIVDSSGHLENFGPGDNSNFRGLIYVNSTYPYNMIFQFGSNSKLYGAIHIASNNKFDINNGNADSARIWFSHPLGQSAVQEIINTGIILAPGQTTPTAQNFSGSRCQDSSNYDQYAVVKLASAPVVQRLFIRKTCWCVKLSGSG